MTGSKGQENQEKAWKIFHRKEKVWVIGEASVLGPVHLEAL